MSTLVENLEKIRGTAIKGVDVREAIAAAIEQSDEEIDARIDVLQEQVDSRNLFVTSTLIENDDYLMTIINADPEPAET